MGILDSAYRLTQSTSESLSETFGDEGQASGTDLGQSNYDFRYLTFPNDLGMDYHGHYMVININVPTRGFKTNGLSVKPVASPLWDRNNQLFTPLNQVSKLDTLRYGPQTFTNEGRPSNGALFSLPRQTRRIAESIALFMPQGTVFSSQNVYQDIEMSAFGKVLGIGIATAAGAAIGAAGGVVGGAVGGAATGLGSIVYGYEVVENLATMASNPINPSIEILFSNTMQRQFTFQFLFAPRNEKESLALKSIIKTLRFHAAPEINAYATGLKGFTWIPPADFDITFFNKGKENLNIQRINTCVLNRVDIDYAPSGIYSTFTNGHPVSVSMLLAFTELEPVHKLRVLQGF